MALFPAVASGQKGSQYWFLVSLGGGIGNGCWQPVLLDGIASRCCWLLAKIPPLIFQKTNIHHET
ncbi:MAG: hypothetical protein H6937_04750 [Burkholderiales bacterium]|nr:hypothetical protein [Burkholderiales bacterium]